MTRKTIVLTSDTRFVVAILVVIAVVALAAWAIAPG
jgi:hypothetical protein